MDLSKLPSPFEKQGADRLIQAVDEADASTAARLLREANGEVCGARNLAEEARRKDRGRSFGYSIDLFDDKEKVSVYYFYSNPPLTRLLASIETKRCDK